MLLSLNLTKEETMAFIARLERLKKIVVLFPVELKFQGKLYVFKSEFEINEFQQLLLKSQQSSNL